MIINPLLDALMIQTLKANAPAPQERGVAPVGLPGEPKGIREAQSDSRLNDRPFHQSHVPGAYGISKASVPTSSTIITLNETARLIADIMAKHPTVDTRLLLAPMTLTELNRPGFMASSLQNLVVFSGLFYESHLARWFRGDYSENLLKNEPQFNQFKEPSLRIVPSDSGSLKSAEDRMHSMIRHQLEVLANPNLIFTGHLMPGIPMQMWLQLGNYIGNEYVTDDGEVSQNSSMKLQLIFRVEHSSFDYVDIELTLNSDALSVKMTGNSILLQEYFRRDFEEIRLKLINAGFSEVNFYRKLHSRLEAKPQFRMPMVFGSCMQPGKHDRAIEQEYGFQAEHIHNQARARGLTPYKGHELLGLLVNLDFDRNIPDELYMAVEVISSWIIGQIIYLQE